MTSPADWLQLRSGGWTAGIDPHGAQLSLLRDAQGRDLLWNGDPAFWNGRAPILFPIVGALNDGHYRWRGQSHALPRHGFARGKRFEVLRHSESEALLRLAADAETLKIYPFHFELDAVCQMKGNALSIEAVVRNVGPVPMPASVGFHPAFRWPLQPGSARNEHFLEFEFDEPAPIRRLDAQGRLTPALHPSPVHGTQLLLSDSLFADDAVIFDQLQSKQVTYGAATGPRLRVSFPDATQLGLWTKPGAGFVCIEPWQGLADPVDFDGDFDAKPGAFCLAPGEQQTLQMHLELLAAP